MSHAVLVVGALGRMGERVRAAVAQEPSLQLHAALEALGHPAIGDEVADGVVLTDDPKTAFGGCAVAIDFTTPVASLAAMRAAADAGVAYVCGTTGFSDEEHAEIAALASRGATPSTSNTMRPGLTRHIQYSGEPLPLPMRTSVGLVLTGTSGKIRIQMRPARLRWPVIARRAASIWRAVTRPGAAALSP